MDDEHYVEFLRHMDDISLHDFFLDAFGLIRDLVTTPIFSNDWSEMLLLQNASVTSHLTSIETQRWTARLEYSCGP